MYKEKYNKNRINKRKQNKNCIDNIQFIVNKNILDLLIIIKELLVPWS